MTAKSPYISPKDWTLEQVQTKLQDLIAHVERLNDDLWDNDLKGLINVHGIFSPELARAALEKEVFRPSEIYYHAPEDVRDGLIAKLLETLYELEHHPRPWREKLYVDSSVYAQCGGWTFDKTRKR